MSRQRKRKAPESTPGTFATQDSSSTTSDSEKRPAKRSNQYLPCPAEEDLIPLVEYYWHLGFNDPNIATHSLDHFDRSKFGLSSGCKVSGKEAPHLRASLPSTWKYVNGSRTWVRKPWSPLCAKNIPLKLRSKIPVSSSHFSG
ncbi:hypothetical protein B0H14DRAFT_2589512 [Mycena olivaceomarginata]|nr:hypothetical protein B0H14DRAFT_2589512 [Mycena olivaceomarginata]